MSSKDQKKKIKEEKKQAAQRRAKVGGRLFKGFAALVILMGAYVFYQNVITGAPVLAPDQISSSDHVRGAEDAALTITMYADFQCPSCLTEAEMIASAWPRIDANTRLVYRYFPLDIHRHGFLSARYAEAASKQDKFWQMHDLLFGNQAFWSELSNVDQIFDGYAAQLDLDMTRLATDLEASEVRQKIIADQQGGIRAGVRGTPVIFFNGRRVPNPRSVSELIEMVNGTLADLQE